MSILLVASLVWSRSYGGHIKGLAEYCHSVSSQPKRASGTEIAYGGETNAANAVLKWRMEQELARTENVAVAFTIHQPSSRDFALFDKVKLRAVCGQSGWSNLDSSVVKSEWSHPSGQT
eukprot:3466463-Rhodomonas_salina.2